MKKAVAVILILTMIFSCSSVFAFEEDAYRLKLDLSQKSPFGEFEGWGTSLCWWGHHLGESLPPEELDIAVKALYDEKEGLGLNIARYNIGGGDDPTHNHMGAWDGRDMPGVMNADGTYDYTKDQGQIDTLKLCIKYGADILEAFANAPPYFMTESGCSSGGKDKRRDNLPKENYGKFAEYLATVVKHFKDEGIVFNTLEPLNEPDTDYWGYEGWQEGCHISPENHSELILAVRKALDEKGLLDVGVSAADETSVDTMANNIKNVYTKEAIETLSQINTHSYHVNNYASLRDAALEAGKKLYMTEVDGDAVSGENAGSMAPALWFSQKITDDLRGLEANAWIMWQAMAMAYTSGSNDTGYWNICQYDHEKKTVNKLKKYYAYMQFTKFIRPGDTLVKANASNVLAAVNEDEGKAVFVITNAKDRERAYDIATENLGMKNVTFEAYVTDQNRDCEKTEIGSINRVMVPANSIMTVTVKGSVGQKSIILKEKEGSNCAFKGDTLEFTVTDETGKEIEAELTADKASADIDKMSVKFTESGKYVVTAKSGELSDSVTIYVSDRKKEIVRIVGRESGKALNGRNEKITISDLASQNSQLWHMSEEDGYFTFKNMRSGEFLSAENGLTIGEKTDSALWTVEKDEGFFKLINKADGKSPDVYGHAQHAGAQVGTYDYNGGANQQWYFIPEYNREEGLETDYTIEPVRVTGEPFGSEAIADLPYTNAWDGNTETYFDAKVDGEGYGGYTGADLGEDHFGVNKLVIYPRPAYNNGFISRIMGADISVSESADGEFKSIYTIKDEEVGLLKTEVYLPEITNARFIKYTSPKWGFCNVGEIELYYEPYQPKAELKNGKLTVDLGKKAPIDGEKYVISYFDEGKLLKTDVQYENNFDAAMESPYSIEVSVYAKDGSLILKFYVNKNG